MKNCLRFALGGKMRFLPLEDVLEVIERRQIFNVPGIPARFIGVINYNGAVVPILKHENDEGASKIILLKTKGSPLGVLAKDAEVVVEPVKESKDVLTLENFVEW